MVPANDDPLLPTVSSEAGSIADRSTTTSVAAAPSTTLPPAVATTVASTTSQHPGAATTTTWSAALQLFYDEVVEQFPELPIMTEEEIEQGIRAGEFVYVVTTPPHDGTCAENATAFWGDPARGDSQGQPDLSGLEPEVVATLMGDVESLRDALDDGGDPDGSVPQGRPLVWFLARIRCYDGVRVLVDAGADPSAGGALYGPLHLAFHDDRLDIVRLLLEAGVPIDDPESEWGWTVAFWADSREAAELVVEYDADLIHEERGVGDQPLDFVVEAGRVDVVEVYLRAGAPLRPRTLYALAANYAEPAALVEVAELLLAHPDLPDPAEFPLEPFGVLPSEYVIENGRGHPEVAEVLRAAGL